MKIATIAWYNLVRLFRERINIFFVLIFPLLIIWIIGNQFGDESAPEVGVAGTGAFADGVAERLADGVDVSRVSDAGELARLVERDAVALGVVLPPDAEEQLALGRGLQVTFLLGSDDEAPQVEQVVTQAIAAEAVVPGVIGQLSGDGDPSEVASVVTGMAAALPDITVDRQVSGGGNPDEEPIAIDQIAFGMLLLMTFMNTLTGATALILSRRLGVSRRMVGTPTPLGVIVLGEGAGRWAVGIFQALYIMVASSLLFGINWGDLPTAVVLVTAFAAVAAGAAMLIGAVMTNDEQAAGITVMVGLALGALGGAMLPLELFGSTLQAIAHVTPHAWAIDAFTDMTRRGATLPDVLPEVGVLAAMAVVLFAIASWRLRVTLTRD
jgi:ABC-2 type transport system permease protein